MYEDTIDAFWHISMISAQINGVSKEMVEHFNKSLDYLENLEDLLEKWQIDYYSDAKPFSGEITLFKEMVGYYQKSQNEIRGLHRSLLKKTDEIKSKQIMEKEDTEEVFSISSQYNYLIYT